MFTNGSMKLDNNVKVLSVSHRNKRTNFNLEPKSDQ